MSLIGEKLNPIKKSPYKTWQRVVLQDAILAEQIFWTENHIVHNIFMTILMTFGVYTNTEQ